MPQDKDARNCNDRNLLLLSSLMISKNFVNHLKRYVEFLKKVCWHVPLIKNWKTNSNSIRMTAALSTKKLRYCPAE